MGEKTAHKIEYNIYTSDKHEMLTVVVNSVIKK